MPSIPQSLLWISLVVLWLFVLVPMLTNRRDAVRRTSDVALAARVLTSGASSRLLKRTGPAAGHRSDPHWKPEDQDDEDLEDDSPAATGSAVTVSAAADRAEPDYLDVDVIDEDSGALAAAAEAEVPAPPADDDGDDGAVSEDSADGGVSADGESGEYEYVEDTSGLEAEEDAPATSSASAVSADEFTEPAPARRRLRYDPTTAAAVSARKYAFRKRVLMVMALILVLSALMAFTVTSTAWWFFGITTASTLLYLAYLRRQTRIEERVRTRRMQRMTRSRPPERARERRVDAVSSRLHRPGAAVLEIDDEDPAFEHLEYGSFARDRDWRHNLPRAAGE